MATICLYGAASNRISDDYIEETEKLGKLLADNGYKMIYGAGASGLMGAAARGMRENGGFIIGVTPHFMHTFEPVYECDETIETTTMAERKSIMEENADAFIVAPGGIGTFDEFFQVLTLKELGRAGDKPIVLFNLHGYYDELYHMMQSSYDKGFLRDTAMSMFEICDTPEDVIKAISKGLTKQ